MVLIDYHHLMFQKMVTIQKIQMLAPDLHEYYVYMIQIQLQVER